MKITGLDLSLTATGISDGAGVRTMKVPLPPRATERQRIERLHLLSCAIDYQCAGTDLVVLEGHSFNSKNTHAHSLGELHGVVKVCLYQRGIPFVIVPPASLKKYATGTGNASKEIVLAAAVKRFPDIDFRDNNQADAQWLRAMAFDHFGDALVLMPQQHLEGLRGVVWSRSA